jgi:hypothetical protein
MEGGILMDVREYYLEFFKTMRSIPGLSDWMYTDNEYLNPSNWPLKKHCMEEKKRPYICMLRKGHPGPHISLVIWFERKRF